MKNLLQSIKQQIVFNAKNIPGWRTKRKIVVIECDDWGGIRMPSKEVYDQLISSGFPLMKDRFTRFDTLAGKEDLETLFHTLKSVSDRNGQAAVMTAITIVANPDFKKIRESGYKKYYYEKFTDTFEKYGLGPEVFEKWGEGMQSGIFVPEMHGRDHITVQIWLKYLREAHPELLKAFDHGFVAQRVMDAPPPARTFRPEFFFDQEDQKPYLIESIWDGVELFRKIFNYTPRLFVPGNAIFHQDFEEAVAGSGVSYLNVSHRTPFPDGKGGLKYQSRISGQRNKNGLIYYVRNCAFEPTWDTYTGIGLTMRQVAAAFRWGKPAIISTHRVNFVGAISPGNREKGLDELHRLLEAIVHQWPDVEFMSSADALGILSGSDRDY